ncbi:MAG: Hsp33 family molecular chaperone HslO [Pseudomonadota bacterium]
MTTIEQIAWDDTVLPFQLDRADIRGRVARLDRSLQRILDQHAYPAPVAALVAEAALLTALIGQTIELRWKLSLQIRGDGPIRLIATDYFGPSSAGAPARVRAYASFDADRLAAHTGTPFQGVGRGMFAILIDQGRGTVPYQGITPLAGGSLAACAETYFAQSEQLPTRFMLAMAEAAAPGQAAAWRSGGVMIQHMPKASPFAQSEGSGEGGLLTRDDILGGEEAEDWNRANLLLDTAETTELIGPHVSPATLLLRLFHEEAPRVFDPQPVSFGCTCGPEKVVQSMSIYSAKDIARMTTDEGKVTADCQFCGAHYELDPAELGFEAEARRS